VKIWVSSLAKVHDIAAEARPERVVSLLAKADAFPTIVGYAEDRHHRCAVDDVREEIEGYVVPSGDHVRALISFVKGWRREQPLLVHCWAGISRSTATAYIAACLHNPGADEAEIADELRRASPTAFPNTRIVALADDILGRRGRMADAAVGICSDADRAALVASGSEAAPFFIPAHFGARVFAARGDGR
jgi:predicted protein tyrosine phosphatase